MELRWYAEYIMVPDWKNRELAEEFWSTICLLRVFDFLGVVEVKPCFGGREHNRIKIVVDDVEYDENIVMWNRRFE